MNDLVIVVIHLAKKSAHIVDLLFQSHGRHFGEVWACVFNYGRSQLWHSRSSSFKTMLMPGPNPCNLCSPTCFCDLPLVLFDSDTLFLKIWKLNGCPQLLTLILGLLGRSKTILQKSRNIVLSPKHLLGGIFKNGSGFLLFVNDYFLRLASNMWLVWFVCLHMWVHMWHALGYLRLLVGESWEMCIL